jgi:hypothetical protein
MLLSHGCGWRVRQAVLTCRERLWYASATEIKKVSLMILTKRIIAKTWPWKLQLIEPPRPELRNLSTLQHRQSTLQLDANCDLR